MQKSNALRAEEEDIERLGKKETNFVFKKKSSQCGRRVMSKDECGGRDGPQAL